MQDIKLTTAGIDKRLLEIYGEEQCIRWKDENPEFLRYLSFELEFGFAIDDHARMNSLNAEVEMLESLDPVNFPVDELLHNCKFNPMRYNLKRSYISRKFYSIGSTGKVLVLFSGEEMRRLFNSAVA